MYSDHDLPPPLAPYCRQWARELPAKGTAQAQIAFLAQPFEALLAETRFWTALLAEIARGAARFDGRRRAMFANEIALYLEPRRRFSLRLYLYDNEEHSPIHDHSAWGLIGSPLNALEVIRYRRVDNGSGHARLEEHARITLSPGASTFTLPLDRGIHATGSPGASPTAMVAVYGKPLRRLHINEFDPITHKVRRRYAPRRHNQQVAQILAAGTQLR